jgi:hypothetical protein
VWTGQQLFLYRSMDLRNHQWPNNAPAPNRRPRFPLGGQEQFEYHICAPPASPAAVGQAHRFKHDPVVVQMDGVALRDDRVAEPDGAANRGSRFAQRQIQRHRRPAPVADLCAMMKNEAASIRVRSRHCVLDLRCCYLQLEVWI